MCIRDSPKIHSPHFRTSWFQRLKIHKIQPIWIIDSSYAKISRSSWRRLCLLYTSIYESFYSPETKNTRHKSFRKIGFVDALIEQGIDDPISHFQKEVNELNSKRETEKCRINFQQISDISPELCLGYVPIAKILNILDVKEHFGYLSSSRKFEFDVYDVFSALVYARVVAPLSKHQTFHDILPKLYVQKNFSYDQLLEGLEFMGEEYEKLVEIPVSYTHLCRSRDTLLIIFRITCQTNTWSYC